MKSCPKCNSSHTKTGKYCSRSCANSRGPRTEEFKTQVRSALADFVPWNKGISNVQLIPQSCIICGTTFSKKYSKKKTCSISCKNEYLKIRVKGKSGGYWY